MVRKTIFIIFLLQTATIFGQLLEETERILKMQALQGQRQDTTPSPRQEFHPPSSPPPSVQSPMSQEQSVIFKEEPLRKEIIVLSDLLLITIDKNYVVAVDGNGYADMPILGLLKVAGLSVDDLLYRYKSVTAIPVTIQIISNPQLSLLGQSKVPQYVNVIGDFVRPGVAPPGTLGSCVANAMGLNPTATGKLYIYHRGKTEKLDFNKIMKQTPEKLNLFIPPGATLYAEKSSGSKTLEGVGGVFGRLRDISLTIIAFIELDGYAKRQGWW